MENVIHKKILDDLKQIPTEKLGEVIDFIEFLKLKYSKSSNKTLENDVVEKTWKTIELKDLKLSKFIAEDIELEYEN